MTRRTLALAVLVGAALALPARAQVMTEWILLSVLDDGTSFVASQTSAGGGGEDILISGTTTFDIECYVREGNVEYLSARALPGSPNSPLMTVSLVGSRTDPDLVEINVGAGPPAEERCGVAQVRFRGRGIRKSIAVN